VAAGLLALAAMAAMFLFDSQLKARGKWVPYLLGAPVYFLVQMFAEGILGAFRSNRSWIAKVLPVVVVLAYYFLWFAVVP
jgi:hypothetical protein